MTRKRKRHKHKVTHQGQVFYLLVKPINTALNGEETVKPTVVHHTAIIVFKPGFIYFFLHRISLSPPALLYCANKNQES